MPRQDYFPTDQGFSSTLLRHGTETPTEERARRLNFDADTLAMEQAITNRMGQLVEMKRQEVDTALQQKAIQQSAAVLPLLNELDPEADDYDEQVKSVFRGNSYARANPAVEQLLQTQRQAREKMGELNLRATESAAAKAEKARAREDAIRGDVAKLGANYLKQFDNDRAAGVDPFSASARIQSQVENSKLRTDLLNDGLLPEEIDEVTTDGAIDQLKARERISTLISKDAFTAANAVISDYAARLKPVGGEKPEPLSPEEQAELSQARQLRTNYLTQLNRKQKKAAPAEQAPAIKFDKVVNYKETARVKE